MTLYEKILERMKNIKFLKQERGAIFVLTALLLPLMFGFLGFAYDVGNLYMHKARLQNTADAAVLAGARAYVNKLGESEANGLVTNAGDNVKATAKAQLKTEAERYIRGNNPLFVKKSARKEQFDFGTRTVSNDTVNKKVNTSEYFRVMLHEPVKLYFLPVIGVRNNVEISVYATTKLSDTEATEGGGNLQPVDAQNRPVVIAGSTFYDEINPTDTTHETYNDYNVSTVYVQTGGTTKARQVNGKYYVPSSQGETTLYVNGQAVRYAEVIETDYDMEAFGVSIKQRFIEKYIATLPTEQQAAKKAKLTEFIGDLKTWNQNKSSWDKKYREEYNRRYQLYLDALGIDKAKEYYEKWQKGELQNIGWLPLPTMDGDAWTNWQWQSYTQFGITQPQPLSNFVTDDIMNGYMAQFGSLGAEPEPSSYGLEYYMTYEMESGGRNQSWAKNLSTLEISNDTSLSGAEHSYFYLPYDGIAKYSGDTNLEVTVDGFYVGGNITEDTPFYLFVDKRITQRFNVTVTNCNRPLVICYLGTCPIHYDFQVDTKGVFYSPHTPVGTIVNASDNIHFSGSLISDYVEMKAHRTSYQYDPDEVKKWQDASEGLPATPNIGFATSGGSSGGTTESSEKITLLDRLRLFLAGGTNQNNYYKNTDIVWNAL